MCGPDLCVVLTYGWYCLHTHTHTYIHIYTQTHSHTRTHTLLRIACRPNPTFTLRSRFYILRDLLPADVAYLGRVEKPCSDALQFSLSACLHLACMCK